MRLLAFVTAACLLAACAPKTTAHAPAGASPSPTPAVPSPSAQPSPVTAPPHVSVIVMENRSYGQVVGNGYIAQLAAQYGVATDYHGVSHPSLPNYLAMTSGSTWGITDDGYHPLAAGGIGAQLDAAGMPWRAYMEGMGSNCMVNGNRYALKHDPFPFYADACPPQVVPFAQFDTDIAGNVPRFVWITPDQCHDGHDCSTAVADQWLSQTVPKSLATSAWAQNRLLV